jgi:hypothetical protein
VDPHSDIEADLAGSVADAVPQRIARAGPSNVASMPSPVSFSWWPENRASCRRTASS